MENRVALIEEYISHIIDDLTISELVSIANEHFFINLINYTEEELISEIKEQYPQILENQQ